jgi:hypothetical protein
MPAKEEAPYKIEYMGPVKAQIRDLVLKASALNKQQEVLDALRIIVHQLRTRPLEWGEPKHRTRHPGGLVCLGIRRPLRVRFVTYDAEKVVCLLEVRALAESFPE